MNFEDLVPPVELCKLIPAGEFEDSVHWYRWSYIDQKYLLDEGKPDVRLYREPCPCGMKYFYPAPTLPEIMAELEQYEPAVYLLHGMWTVQGINKRCKFFDHADEKNPATAALKLWLKLKGIEG